MRWKPKQSRTIPIPTGDKEKGNGLDYKNWFRCWNCGTINQLGVDALGGDSSPSGAYPVDYVTKQDPYTWLNDIRNASIPAMAVIDSFEMAANLLQLGPDGQPIPIPHNYLADVSAGCRLCGSLNWKGEI